MTGLSQDQVELYHKQGFLVVPNFYSPEQCRQLKSEIRRVIESEKQSGSQEAGKGATFNAAVDDGKQNTEKYFMESGDKIRFFYEDISEKESEHLNERPLNKIGHALHWHNNVFRELSLDYPKTIDILRSLGYVRPSICQSMYIFKREKVGGAVRPHTDGTFLITTGPVVGFWMPLEDATVTNGCLWFEPGSHLNKIESFFERSEESNFETMKLRNPQEFSESKFIPVEVKAGDLVLIHKAVIHQSEKNTSEKPRDAFTFHVNENFESDWSKLNWLQHTGSPASFSVVYDDSN